MNRYRFVLLIGLFVLWPRVASAQIDWLWDWGERFIGPGPWNGMNAIVRFHCGKFATADATKPNTVRIARDQDDLWCWDNDADSRIAAFFELRGGFAYTGGLFFNRDPVLFGDLPDERDRMYAVKLEPFLMARLNPLIDVGGGMGLVRFMGEGFSFTRFVATAVSVIITPLAAIHSDDKRWRWLKFRYELNYMPQGLDAGRDFNSTSKYHMDTEWTGSAGIMIDILAFK